MPVLCYASTSIQRALAVVELFDRTGRVSNIGLKQQL